MKICLSGATGGVGRHLARAILVEPGLELHSAIARRRAGEDIGTVVGVNACGVLVSADIAAALDARPDVLIDYTHPEAIIGHCLAAFERGIPVVIGTTGLHGSDMERLDAAARAAGVGAATGNFSLTAALMQHFALIAARHVPHWEVLEYNKPGKPDAPSGTATDLAEQLSAVRRPQQQIPTDEVIGLPASRGAQVDGTPVHAVRLPGFSSSCEAIFGLPGERLTIRHDMLGDDAIFVTGTLLAARRVREFQGLVRGFDRLLFGSGEAA